MASEGISVVLKMMYSKHKEETKLNYISVD